MSKDSLRGTCGRAERESCKDQAEVLPSALVTPVLHPDPQPDRIQVPDGWGGWGALTLGKPLPHAQYRFQGTNWLSQCFGQAQDD